MAVASVRVSGVRELTRTLRAIDAGLARQVNIASRSAAGVVATEAQRRAPEQSGRLKRSIRPAATARGVVVRAGGARVPYAGAIEYGWAVHNIRPNPFLEDAAAAKRAEVAQVFVNAIDALIRSAGLAGG